MRSYRFTLGLIAVALAIGAFTSTNFAQDTDEKLTAEEMIEKGQQLLRQENFEDAAEFFKKAVKEDESIGLAWQLLGYSLHAAGDLDAAIPAHEKAASFEQFKPVALYNLGCAYSLKKELDKSFEYLNKAVAIGFDDVDQFDGDSDLDNLRKDPRYAKLMDRIEHGDEPQEKKEKKKSSMSLAGEWQVESGSRMGNEVDASGLPPVITVDDEVFRIPTPDGADDFVMSYEIDKSTKPIAVDFEIESGPAPESKAMGIIKVDEGAMTLCYDPTGENRPEKFESTEDNGFHLFVMKKKPAVFSAEKLIGDWMYITGSRAGEDVAKERLTGSSAKFTKDEITLPGGPDMTFVMSYELDTQQSPVAIDMKVKSGPAPEGSPAIGIVKMEGGHFILCYDSTGAKRPEKFETSEEDGFFMFKLKKAVID